MLIFATLYPKLLFSLFYDVGSTVLFRKGLAFELFSKAFCKISLLTPALLIEPSCIFSNSNILIYPKPKNVEAGDVEDNETGFGKP